MDMHYIRDTKNYCFKHIWVTLLNHILSVVVYDLDCFDLDGNR